MSSSKKLNPAKNRALRNIRERERVAEMSAAFNKLKEKLSFQSWEKPTKKRILRNAISYIKLLKTVLEM